MYLCSVFVFMAADKVSPNWFTFIYRNFFLSIDEGTCVRNLVDCLIAWINSSRWDYRLKTKQHCSIRSDDSRPELNKDGLHVVLKPDWWEFRLWMWNFNHCSFTAHSMWDAPMSNLLTMLAIFLYCCNVGRRTWYIPHPAFGFVWVSLLITISSGGMVWWDESLQTDNTMINVCQKQQQQRTKFDWGSQHVQAVCNQLAIY